ncbi:MAG: hypothetical protein NTV86_13090 [Planctomycetota bacterium]|nr:hypothetical protein [Planctomycetota bacterium]
MYIGNLIEDQIVDFSFNTHSAAGAPITLAGTPVVKVYKANSTTTETDAGVTLSVDFDGVTGLHHVRIDTSAGAFYQGGYDYSAVLVSGTVEGVSVAGTALATFSIENRSTGLAAALSACPAAGTVGEALVAALANAKNKIAISGTTLTLYKADGSTPLYVWTLNSPTEPTSRTPA